MSSKTRSNVDTFVYEFNKRHAAILVKDKFVILTEIKDPPYGQTGFYP